MLCRTVLNLLLDTHMLIWALTEDERLSDKARELILDPDNTIYYSAVSIWEVFIKHAVHPENVEFTGKEFASYCQMAGYLSVEMREKHVFALETLQRSGSAPAHNDSFDRILIAQAKAENMNFLTHDPLLGCYNEKCVLLV